jgi:hypothetical protein
MTGAYLLVCIPDRMVEYMAFAPLPETPWPSAKVLLLRQESHLFEHGHCEISFSCIMYTILHTCIQAKKEKKYIPPVYHSTLPKLTHYLCVKIACVSNGSITG